jgi:SAM-dependent methyltransferase
MTPHPGDGGWNPYLATFHTERPGITEAILGRAVADDDRRGPYDWVAAALPDDGVILDVACGSGPLATRVTGRWVGLDRNPAELRLAAAGAPRRVLLADAESIPVRTGGVDAVVCSMALMLLDDPRTAVAELARVLRVGGRFVALIPATSPLTIRDRIRYARLLAALRVRELPFRHQWVLADPGALLATVGLTVLGTQRRRFAYPFTSPDDAPRWMRSLYLPGLDERRWRAALSITGQWTGTSIGIPLRRLIATKHP